MRRLSVLAAAGAGFLAMLAGCGRTEQDGRAARDPTTHAKGDLDSADRLRAKDSERMEETRRQIHALRGKLDDLQARVDDTAKGQAPPASAVGQGHTEAPAQTNPHEGKGGGPTRCADGSLSGESGRGACSHHGGIARSSAHQRH
jgi:hypothetical protein